MATKTPRLLGKELKKYFRAHVTPKRVRHQYTHWDGSVERGEEHGFFTVTKPLQVYKKTYVPCGASCITNLVIPVGAIIYAAKSVFNAAHTDDDYRTHERKMRASVANVHSSATRMHGANVPVAISEWDHSFEYVAGKSVTPRSPFYMSENQCSSGIHFFINLQDAIDYAG